jgi:hypothetical protein
MGQTNLPPKEVVWLQYKKEKEALLLPIPIYYDKLRNLSEH